MKHFNSKPVEVEGHLNALRQLWQQCANDRRMIEADALNTAIEALAQQPASSAPDPATGDAVAMQPVAWQFQDRDGKWHGFVDEQHRQNTIADGSWPIRALYTAPQSASVRVEDKARAMFEAQADKLTAPWDRQWEPTKGFWRKRAAEALAQQPASSVPEAQAQEGRGVDYTDIANRVREITGRFIWPSMVKAVLKVAGHPAPPRAPVGVEAALSLLRAGHWREVHVGRRYMRLEVTYDYAAWERLMEQVEAALAQQPAADGYCVTREDGECVSSDLRCMHNKPAAVVGLSSRCDLYAVTDRLASDRGYTRGEAVEDLRLILAQQHAACVGCEGNPAPENSPCAVCGQQPAAVVMNGEDAVYACDVLQADGGWAEEFSREVPPDKYYSIRNIRRYTQQPAAVEEALRKVAAIAHSGGLIDMSPHDALTAIRRLSLPYWGKEEKPEQVHAALAAQPGGSDNDH